LFQYACASPESFDSEWRNPTVARPRCAKVSAVATHRLSLAIIEGIVFPLL
jgi:hypothetical protein